MLFKKALNRIKEKIIEIMTIGKDLKELEKDALDIAKNYAYEEFKRRYNNEKGIIAFDERVFIVWLNNHQKEYNEMIKLSYHQWLSEMKKFYMLEKSIKDIKKIFEEEDKEKK